MSQENDHDIVQSSFLKADRYAHKLVFRIGPEKSCDVTSTHICACARAHMHAHARTHTHACAQAHTRARADTRARKTREGNL